MTPDELAAFKARLGRMRDELLATETMAREAAQTVVLDQSSVGRLSRMDAMQAQAIAVETQARNQRRLRDIAAALVRIESGDYGDCIDCGEPIDPRRIDYDPAVRLCIACAERGDRTMP